jgi:hypothetical protein
MIKREFRIIHVLQGNAPSVHCGQLLRRICERIHVEVDRRELGVGSGISILI